jgi:4-amino-4-deoxy-L-arabinose transferase-like glycosyltransferase
MDDCSRLPAVLQRWGLRVVLVFACAIRLLNIDAALLNGMGIKQVFVAHRARHIAQPPFSLFRSQFDFLTEDGEPLTLVEEVPLYPGIVAVGYWLFGEHEWLGRLASVLAAMVAIAALYDLVRRELGEQLALLTALFFSLTPLLLFFGQAFQPDVSMLACMLLATCAYRRYLEHPRWSWYAATLAAGLLGALFKYYGLMVLVPLAFMTYRHFGRRWVAVAAWLGLAVVMCLPVALWLTWVFFAARNPAQYISYYIFQKPELLIQNTLYYRFLDRFLYKDCGLVLALLILVGAWAVWRRGTRSVTLLGWTTMGLMFFILLGPMLATHNYYELMMLPAASLWGALGWHYLWHRPKARLHWLGVAVLAAMVVVQCPFIMRGSFKQDSGMLLTAQRLQDYCDSSGRLVVAGTAGGTEVLHYARRQGWAWEGALPGDWEQRLDHYRQRGAGVMLIYLTTDLTPAEQQAYRQVIARLPVLEKGAGTWDRGHRAEYYILDLRIL